MSKQNHVQNIRFIGIVSEGFSNPNTVKMLNEVTRQLTARGCAALLVNVGPEDDFRTALHSITPTEPAGLLFLSQVADDELNTVAEILPHVATVHLCSAANRADVVCPDGYRAGEEAGRMLLSQGFRRFGFLQSRDAPLQMREGYAQSLAAAGKTVEIVVAGSDDRELAYQVMTAYLKKSRSSERVNALFCENDVLAFGAMQAVRDFGQGVHIGVIGYDDVDEAHASTWHLTSWATRCDLQVEEALNRLLENRADTSNAWQQGAWQVRHSHLGKEVSGEMAKCGCASRH